MSLRVVAGLGATRAASPVEEDSPHDAARTDRVRAAKEWQE
jgi:hypothetical protein